MAKLKYDRPINIPFPEGTEVTVPKDEVWKITAEINTGNHSQEIATNLYGGGYNFHSGSYGTIAGHVLTGIAFKHIDDE